MKKLVLLFVMTVIIAITSHSQIVVYSRYTAGGKIELDINAYLTKRISDKFDLTFFGLLEKEWSEGLIGVSYSPVKWFSVGASVGVEHGGSSPRLGTSLWFGNGKKKIFSKTSLLLLWEKGGGKGNYWYKGVFTGKISDKLSVGAIGWRYHGIGPSITLTPKGKDVSLWLNPTHDFEFKEKRVMVGVSVKL